MTNISRIIETLVKTGAHSATYYYSPKEIIRVTRLFFRGKPRKGLDARLKAGRPNYQERAFIKQLIKSGQPFPLRKIQLKFVSKR